MLGGDGIIHLHFAAIDTLVLNDSVVAPPAVVCVVAVLTTVKVNTSFFAYLDGFFASAG